MRKRLLVEILAGWTVHWTLWFVSEDYRSRFYTPDFLVDFVARVLDYRQVEELPEAKAGAVLIFGFFCWTVVVTILANIVGRRAKVET